MAANDDLIATRVIVSCDASPLGATAIDAAAALARGLDAELKGIFVEDINLFRTAALPFTREVASLTALASRMHPGKLQRLLEGQAQSVREVLAQAAAACGLQWSFQVVRGVPLGSVLDAMSGLDLAVFGHGGRFSATSTTAPAPRIVVPAQGVVMVVFDGTAAAQRALGAAEALVRSLRGRLVVALTGAAGGTLRLREQTRERLEQQHAHALFVNLKQRDAVAVGQAAETYAPAVLLWGGVEGDADRATFATLVDALRCPVVLVA